jgi:hypothetical protein
VHPQVDGNSAGLPIRVLAKRCQWNQMWWFKGAVLGMKNSVGWLVG